MGFTAGYFSFNSEGGRCEECKGEGSITIEMQFMADIVIPCEACHGQRYKQEVLDIKYRGVNINDVLNMTVNQAIEFFEGASSAQERKIVRRLQPLKDVGLGYIKLGQALLNAFRRREPACEAGLLSRDGKARTYNVYFR